MNTINGYEVKQEKTVSGIEISEEILGELYILSIKMRVIYPEQRALLKWLEEKDGFEIGSLVNKEERKFLQGIHVDKKPLKAMEFKSLSSYVRALFPHARYNGKCICCGSMFQLIAKIGKGHPHAGKPVCGQCAYALESDPYFKITLEYEKLYEFFILLQESKSLTPGEGDTPYCCCCPADQKVRAIAHIDRTGKDRTDFRYEAIIFPEALRDFLGAHLCRKHYEMAVACGFDHYLFAGKTLDDLKVIWESTDQKMKKYRFSVSDRNHCCSLCGCKLQYGTEEIELRKVYKAGKRLGEYDGRLVCSVCQQQYAKGFGRNWDGKYEYGQEARESDYKELSARDEAIERGHMGKNGGFEPIPEKEAAKGLEYNKQLANMSSPSKSKAFKTIKPKETIQGSAGKGQTEPDEYQEESYDD